MDSNEFPTWAFYKLAEKGKLDGTHYEIERNMNEGGHSRGGEKKNKKETVMGKNTKTRRVQNVTL